MNTYLVIYDVRYIKLYTDDERREELMSKMEDAQELKKMNKKSLLIKIYNSISENQLANRKEFSNNLIIKTDKKGENLFNFIVKEIQNEWTKSDREYHEISITDILNLDSI